MIRKGIIDIIKKLDLKVLRWQDYNTVWDDLHYRCGITKEEFFMELNLMVEEGLLLQINCNSHYPDYRISEGFLEGI